VPEALIVGSSFKSAKGVNHELTIVLYKMLEALNMD